MAAVLRLQLVAGLAAPDLPNAPGDPGGGVLAGLVVEAAARPKVVPMSFAKIKHLKYSYMAHDALHLCGLADSKFEDPDKVDRNQVECSWPDFIGYMRSIFEHFGLIRVFSSQGEIPYSWGVNATSLATTIAERIAVQHEVYALLDYYTQGVANEKVKMHSVAQNGLKAIMQIRLSLLNNGAANQRVLRRFFSSFELQAKKDPMSRARKLVFSSRVFNSFGCDLGISDAEIKEALRFGLESVSVYNSVVSWIRNNVDAYEILSAMDLLSRVSVCYFESRSSKMESMKEILDTNDADVNMTDSTKKGRRSNKTAEESDEPASKVARGQASAQDACKNPGELLSKKQYNSLKKHFDEEKAAKQQNGNPQQPRNNTQPRSQSNGKGGGKGGGNGRWCSICEKPGHSAD